MIAPDKLTNLNIMIIDDDAFTRKVIRRVLTNLGFTSIIDADGSESALKLINKEPPFDIFITDVEMPRINGLELIRLVRCGKTKADPSSRFILLTSFSNTDVIKTAMGLGINGFIVKPIKPATLLDKITKAHDEPFFAEAASSYEAISTNLSCINSDNDADGGKLNAAILKDIDDKNAYHARLRLDRLQPGMRLRQNVISEEGGVLLRDGQILTSTMISRLQELEGILESREIWVFQPPG
jgi:YesN/AraC family two-component response regulator